MLRSLGVACPRSSPLRIRWCPPTSSVAGRAVRPTSSTVLWMHQMSQHRARMAMTTQSVCWGSPPRAAHGQALHRQPEAVVAVAVAADADDVRSLRTARKTTIPGEYVAGLERVRTPHSWACCSSEVSGCYRCSLADSQELAVSSRAGLTPGAIRGSAEVPLRRRLH